MNKRLVELASRRQRLLEKIESQRMEVAAIAAQWEKPLALADRGMEVLRVLRHHPVLASGGVAALLTWRRKGIFGLLRKGWRLLRLYSSPASFILKLIFPAAHSKTGGRKPGRDH